VGSTVIARLSVVLPFAFDVPVTTSLKPIEFQRNGRTVHLHPPQQSELRAQGGASSVMSLSMIAPASSPVTSPYVRINGTDTIAADLVVVDFVSDSFDRSAGQSLEREQLLAEGFAIVNQWLTAYRNFLGAVQVAPVSQTTSSSRLDYLNNDGSALLQQPGLVRGAVAVYMRVQGVAGLAEEAWKEIANLGPEYRPFRWDELLVDAAELLPAVGPSIFLAYAALEIRIVDAANVLAVEQKLHAGIWKWFTQERGLPMRPDTEELAKTVFTLLGGKSLTQEKGLWDTFTQLRKARNSFTHGGVARDTNRKEITPGKAAELVAGARPILDWIEALLPPQNRRHKFTATTTLEVVSAPVKVQ
jgi:hypothetical protein